MSKNKSFLHLIYIGSIFSIFCLLLFPQSSKAQTSLRCENYIYDSSIKTVELKQTDGDPLTIINMNSDDVLRMDFDQLGVNNTYYQYSFIFCDANWNAYTEYDFNAYAQGLQYTNIENWKFSSNAYQKYVHYTFDFPSNNFKFLYAGNYILKVCRTDNAEVPIITRRFMVCNQKVSFTATIKPATDAKYRFSKQEMDVIVDNLGYNMPNPYADAKIVITQNNRWDNAISAMKPRFINGGKLDYNFEDVNLFNGGSEFRMFDIRTLRTYSQNVARKYFDTIYHCLLNVDESRAALQYMQVIDFDGRRSIANNEGVSNDPDYAYVHFSLSSVDPYKQDIYVFGELTDWQMKPEFKMIYNKDLFRYECKTKLKQGVYNYMYVAQDPATTVADETLIEGNHMETENAYTVYFYYKNLIYNYDELIGAQNFSSTNAGR